MSLSEALFQFSLLLQTINTLIIPETHGLIEAILIMVMVLLVHTMNSLTEYLRIYLCVLGNPNFSQV